MCTYDRIPPVPSTANNMKEQVIASPSSSTTTTTTTTTTQSSSRSQHHHRHHHHQDASMELLQRATSFDAADDNKHQYYYTIKDTHGSSHTTALSTFMYMVVGVLTSIAVTLFSLYFPFWLAPQAAQATYDLAFYHYEKDGVLHHFDTTAWTYGTDYGLAIVMVFWSLRLYAQRPRKAHHHQALLDSDARLCRRIWGLLLGYAVSTLAGAISHQFYTEMHHRNTWQFRVLWTTCVGTVTLASLSMGCIGSEMARQFQPHIGGTSLPFVPEIFWTTFGIVTTCVCAFGWFSYQRPACDIFIAGITQFPSSFYMITVLWQAYGGHGGTIHCSNGNTAATTTSSTSTITPATTTTSPLCLYLRPVYQWMGMASFILNAPLLPLYPLLVQYTDWSLAKVNTFLHTWLLITWSMQAISLTHVRRALVLSHQRPAKAMPVIAASAGAATAVPGAKKKEN